MLCKGFGLGAIVPDEVVGCQLGLRDFVEDQGELVLVITSPVFLLLEAYGMVGKFLG